jgi:hypothetical protein
MLANYSIRQIAAVREVAVQMDVNAFRLALDVERRPRFAEEVNAQIVVYHEHLGIDECAELLEKIERQ